ncbi:MAG: phosphate regulon sensor histidine kinase PhoR [Gammaproteobacteria bacterium]
MKWAWIKEIAWFMTGLLLALLGWAFWGHPVPIFLVWAILLLGRHYRQLAHWLAWLGEPEREIPEGTGIWGGVAHAVRWRMRSWRVARFETEPRFDLDQALLAAWPDPVLILDDLGRLKRFNVRAEELLGLNPQKDIGQFVGNLLRNPALLKLIQFPREQGLVEISSPRNEEQILEVSVAAHGSGGTIMWVRDVSEHKRAEQRGRDLVANASHELKTPLTVLSGYLEMLLDEGSMHPEHQKILSEMQRETERMKTLVLHTLELMRLETSGEKAPDDRVPVQAILDRLKQRIDLLDQGRREVTFAVEPLLIAIRGSDTELTSAFWNLVDNALKFTNPGGHISITWESDGGGGVFRVTDDGIGIPPERVNRITERFYRVNTYLEGGTAGSGLGLAIVQNVLKRHQAKLICQSQMGKGSTFNCYFPSGRVERASAVATGNQAV